MALEAAPPVPLKGEVVNDRRVHPMTKREGVLLWDGKEGLVETDGGKRVVGVLFEQLKRRVQAKRTRSEGGGWLGQSNIGLTRD
jgi:hypothetical protein